MSSATLPQGWARAVIGDYLYLKNGYAFKSNDYVEKSQNTFPVIRISDLNGTAASSKSAIHVEEGANGFEVKDGDLLIAMSGATTGKVGVFKGVGVAYQNQRVGNLKLHSDRLGNPSYRNYLILALSSQILKIAYGGAQPNISGKAIENIETSFPPLAEQKAIAEKLDTLLAQVETTKARLDRIPDTLKRFRQSALAAAVSGKLTEEWRAQNEVAHQSFEKIAAESKRLIAHKEIKKDLAAQLSDVEFVTPDIWITVKLKSIAIKITDGEHKTPKREASGFYLLSARNVRDGYIALSNVDYVGEEEFLRLRRRCDPNRGDVLISCSGSVGRVSLVDEDDKYVMVRSAALVRTNKSFVENKYLAFVLRSPALQVQIEKGSKSTAQSNLFLGPIKELDIPLPSIEEQAEIVRRIEQLFAHADAIEQQVKAASERVNNLTQSILAKAFRGELTADWRAANPELITGKNSAEALLAKIKAERAAMQPKKKARKKP